MPFSPHSNIYRRNDIFSVVMGAQLELIKTIAALSVILNEALCSLLQIWKNETMKQELALKRYEDPILKPDELRNKIVDLNREVCDSLFSFIDLVFSALQSED